MKNLLILFAVFIANLSFSQTQLQENNIKLWFNNYGICKCITQAYWIKGIKTEDKSILFWNGKMPISLNNVENLESIINLYIKKNIKTNDLILKNCILIIKDKSFLELIERFIKYDKVLQSIKFNLKD